MENPAAVQVGIRSDPKLPFVVVSCLLGAASALYFLYRDFNAPDGVANGKPMARLERFDSKVRRKSVSSFVWKQVQPNEELYRKEYVQTAEGSSAVIRLNTGALLELKENSLIILDDASELSLNFVQGGGVLKTAQGDARVSAGADGKAKVEALSARLLKPEPLAEQVTAGQSGSVQFAWETSSKEAKTVQVQVSASPEFIPSQTRSVPGKGAATLALKPGAYYWRIVKGKEPLSEVGRFSLLAAPSVTPVFPAKNALIQIWGSDSPVQFRWVSEGERSKFQMALELSSDPGFKKIDRAVPVSAESGAALLQELPQGALQWRIKIQRGDFAAYSPAGTFTVRRSERLALALGAPTDELAAPLPKELRFDWSADQASDSVTYRLQIQTSEGKSVEEAATGSASSWTWKSPDAGLYRWRALADWNGKEIGASAWRSFSLFKNDPIVLKEPAKSEAIHYWDTPPKVSFSWKNDPMVEGGAGNYSYLLEISPSAAFDPVFFSQKTKSNHVADVSVDPKERLYFWKISVITEKGQRVKASDPYSFAYGIFPPPPAPANLALENGIIQYNPIDRGRDPVLSWAEVERAKAYEVAVYKKEGGKSGPLIQRTQAGTTLVLDKIEEGDYQWMVTPIDRLGRKGEPSGFHSFSITYGSSLEPPKSLSEEVQ